MTRFIPGQISSLYSYTRLDKVINIKVRANTWVFLLGTFTWRYLRAEKRRLRTFLSYPALPHLPLYASATAQARPGPLGIRAGAPRALVDGGPARRGGDGLTIFLERGPFTQRWHHQLYREPAPPRIDQSHIETEAPPTWWRYTFWQCSVGGSSCRPVLKMASSQDAWYLSLLGLAEHFRSLKPPDIKSCVQCLQAVFNFSPPPRVEARTHLQLGNILLNHTKNSELARKHLEKAVSCYLYS